MKTYYIIYRITNNINNKIYIGQHTTTKIDDGYMGSGVALNRSFNKYGKENFTKEILFTYDNFEDMNNKEIEIVNEEFVNRKDTYNITLGGHTTHHLKGYTTGKVTVSNSLGETLLLEVDDPRIINGEFTTASKGKVSVRDKDGNTLQVSVDDPRYTNGELVHVSYGITKGRKHIHNPSTGERTIVSPEELDSFLENGWVLGRILKCKYNLPPYQELQNELKNSSLRKMAIKYNVSRNTIAYRIHNKI